MNKAQIVKAVAHKLNINEKDISVVFDNILEEIADSLENDKKVSLIGFGVFENHIRSATECRSFKTGETIVVPSRINPVFRASKALKERVNKKDEINK